MRFHGFAVAMVTVVLGGAASIGCAASAADGAEASGATTSDLHAGDTVTTSALEKAVADEEQNWLDDADGCTFSSKEKDGALVLTLTGDKGTVTLEVAADATIKQTEKDGDGSVIDYDIKGVGTVEITHADDAFISFALTSAKTHKTTTCEEDF